jgi:hypothetical protein
MTRFSSLHRVEPSAHLALKVSARAAESHPITVAIGSFREFHHRILGRVGMPLRALRYTFTVIRVLIDMLPWRQWLKMAWIHTSRSFADVMQMISGWNRTYEVFVKQSMCLPDFAFMADMAVASGMVGGSRPNAAFAFGSRKDLIRFIQFNRAALVVMPAFAAIAEGVRHTKIIHQPWWP